MKFLGGASDSCSGVFENEFRGSFGRQGADEVKFALRYLDDGFFRGVAEKVFGCYTREWESALSKRECVDLVRAGSGKELRGLRVYSFKKLK